MNDEDYMRICLDLADEAQKRDEVPVGAIIVHKGEIIAKSGNSRENDRMATHHAEICAIEQACKVLYGWRLPDCTLYVTMEPCPMCAGAVINSRISRVVFGTYDLRAGAFGSVVNLAELNLNHKPEITGGVLSDECRNILSEYFKKKRKEQ